MTATILQAKCLTVCWGDRVLVQGLSLSLENEKVALIGRNGVGKSTLLSVLAGERAPDQGEIRTFGPLQLVAQTFPKGECSPGELRRLLLEEAFSSEAALLLLDEPSQDLDQESVEWLRWQLSRWEGACLVATHDRRLLSQFEHFFYLAESGCRYLSCSFAEAENELEREQQREEERYLSRLHALTREEERTLHIARRRRRKKQYGRAREMDRATSRLTLNQKRSKAQVSHGRINTAREAKLQERREWTRSARQALRVTLPLELQLPSLGKEGEEPIVKLSSVGASEGGKLLFTGLDISINRQRLAVTGPNGAGKTTLLNIMSGKRSPDSGQVQIDSQRLGLIEQGGVNWMLQESLIEYLEPRLGHKEAIRRIAAHKFPLALALRPLRTLSPGERVRAALLGLLSQQVPVELLLLDEPTYSLDLLGQRALNHFLKIWPGGLVVASHDHKFLEDLNMDQALSLAAGVYHGRHPTIAVE